MYPAVSSVFHIQDLVCCINVLRPFIIRHHFHNLDTRLIPSCNATTTYNAAIDQCVSNAVAALPAFPQSFNQAPRTCTRNYAITTAADLEGIRYCSVISSSLIIAVNDPNADYTALFDIKTIMGMLFDDWRRYFVLILIIILLIRAIGHPQQQHPESQLSDRHSQYQCSWHLSCSDQQCIILCCDHW